MIKPKEEYSNFSRNKNERRLRYLWYVKVYFYTHQNREESAQSYLS